MRRNNLFRARKISAALKKWHSDPYSDFETKITDALADMRHLCDQKGLDFADLDRKAYNHYSIEKKRTAMDDPNFIRSKKS